jgi:hypothetical protein
MIMLYIYTYIRMYVLYIYSSLTEKISLASLKMKANNAILGLLVSPLTKVARVFVKHNTTYLIQIKRYVS